MKIIQIIQKLEGHISYVNKIIELKYFKNEKYLASSSTATKNYNLGKRK